VRQQLEKHDRQQLIDCLFDWLVTVNSDSDSPSLPALDATSDPFQSLSVDQPLIDFEAQSQLMSASTTSPVDLLLSASAEQGCYCIHSVASAARKL